MANGAIFVLPWDLFSRKIIDRHISSKHDVNLTMTAFHKAYSKRNIQYGLIFHYGVIGYMTPNEYKAELFSINLCLLY